MEENLFDNVQQSPVKHAASWFSIRKKCHKKKTKKKSKTKQNNKKNRKRVTPGWTDISGPGPASVLSRNVLRYADST